MKSHKLKPVHKHQSARRRTEQRRDRSDQSERAIATFNLDIDSCLEKRRRWDLLRRKMPASAKEVFECTGAPPSGILKTGDFAWRSFELGFADLDIRQGGRGRGL